MRFPLLPERNWGNHRRHGFALVIALSLMAFLLLLVLAMSTLVRVETASSETATQRLRAKQNALLGFQIALGNLQKLTGPDQRATATADLLETGYSAIAPAEAARRWTEVWDSTEPDPGAAFLGWLVSSPGPGSLLVEESDTATPPAQTRRLVGPGTVGSADSSRFVEVPFTAMAPTGGEESGGFAYWVGDEGVKARFQGVFPSEGETDAARRRADFRLNQRNAIETYGDPSADPSADAFTAAMSDQPRSFSRSELLLPDRPDTEVPPPELLKESFYDFSPYPVGLLTDAKDGGWKKDLTWLFEEADVSSELASMDANPSFPGSQLTGDWPADPARRHWPAPPSWELLRDFYRLSDASPPFEARPQENGRHGITPAITHFAISFIPGLDGVVEDNDTAAEDDDYFRGRLRVHIDLRITLWNPYDVPIELPESDLEILWRQSDNGVDVDAKMYFGTVSVDGSGNVSGGASHTGSMITNFAGSGGTGFFEFNDRFYDDNDCHGLSFRLPQSTIGPGEIAFFTVADSEDGLSYTGQNRLESVQNIGFPNTVWMQHSEIIDTGTSPLAGEDLVNAPFTFFKRDVVSGGPIIHHIALRGAGNAGNDSPGTYGDYLGRFLTRKGSPGAFTQIFNQDSNDLVEEIFGDPPIRGTALAGASPLASHSLQQQIEMQSSNRIFRSSRWARNYNPRAPIMRKTEVDPSNNPLTMGQWISSAERWSGPFLNTTSSDGLILAADRPTYNNSYAEHRVALYSLPRAGYKPLSIADLRHVDAQPRSASNNYPISGSLVDMRMSDTSETVRLPANADRYAPNVDGAYLLNEALWDAYFFSTIDGSLTQAEIDSGERFPNARIRLAEGRSLSGFENNPDRFATGAAQLEVVGQFNVNSTSKEAWKSVLAATNGLPYDPVDDVPGPELGVAFSRLLSPHRGDSTREDSWLNYRTLEESALDTLAEEIVRGVRQRGPFLSLGDFVNRRLDQPAPGYGLQGVLAQAIDDATVNLGTGELDLPPAENNPGDSNWSQVVDAYIEEAVLGSRSAGATRWLLQGDLLARIGGMVAVRSDTFTIRSYGLAPAGPGGNSVRGEAFLEAIVQRIPEAVEPQAGDPFSTSGNFGRKFKILSLRWLSREDV